SFPLRARIVSDFAGPGGALRRALGTLPRGARPAELRRARQWGPPRTALRGGSRRRLRGGHLPAPGDRERLGLLVRLGARRPGARRRRLRSRPPLRAARRRGPEPPPGGARC